MHGEQYDIGDPVKQVPQPELDVQLLTVNEYPDQGLQPMECVVWWFIIRLIQEVPHRIIGDYFESLKDTGGKSGQQQFYHRTGRRDHSVHSDK